MGKFNRHRKKLQSAIINWILLSSIFILPLLTFIKPVGSEPWWPPGWTFKKQITINHTMVSADLANFPVLIDIIDPDLKAKAQSDGDDILFIGAGNYTLSYEIEQYDSSTGHLVAWVKIPSLLSTQDTIFDMYYGNPDAKNQQNASAVWDSNFVMVHHLEEKSTNRYDSTSYGNNGTAYGGLVKSEIGKIDGADELDGVNDYVGVPDKSALHITGPLTIEAWFNSKQGLTSKPNTWFGGLGKGGSYELGWQGWTDGWTFQIFESGTRLYIDSRNVYMPAGEWHYVVGQYDGQYLKIFFDGQQVANKSIGLRTIDINTRAFQIGLLTWGSSYWNGTIDEVHISNTARSAEWIQTSYNNQKDPTTFYTIGTEERSPTAFAPLVSDENPTDGMTDTYTNPTLSIRVLDPYGQNMTIIFQQKVLNTWQEIGLFSNVPSGTYSVIPTLMDKLATTYYWNVSVTNGVAWTNKSFSFTTTTKILQQKWVASSLSTGVSGVLTYDVDGDGIEEVFFAARGLVVALKGTDGHEIWRVSDSNIGYWAQPQMADLNKDGILEIIVPLESPAGLLVLHANDGSEYWRITGLGGETYSSPVICDIDGNGYPTIFIGSTDVYHGLSGSGRITALSYDGKILRQTFAWRPCAGGFSIADTDGDGEFELYMGDRNMYLNSAEYGDNDYGKGVQSYWAKNLTLRWSYPSVFCSSPIPILADANNDGILDVIVGDLNGGVVVLNASDGSAIRIYQAGLGVIPTHYQSSVCDIDNDGNLEILMADPHDDPLDPSNEWASDDIVVFDLVNWKVDQRIYLGKSFYGPQEADVNGDGFMEIIACNYKGIFIIDSSGRVLDGITGLTGTLNYAVAQDIDGDGYTEIVVSSQGGYVYAYDTPARRPTERPRTEVQFYSEYRKGAAEYIPPPGCQEPVITPINPPNNAEDVPLSLSQLEFTITDYQHNLMNYTITTNPDIGSNAKINATNGKYTLNIINLAPSTTYTWTINLTDGTNWTNKTFAFTTEPLYPRWNADWPYRKKITIDHNKVSADLQNFPVLISIDNDLDLANKAKPDGGDIVFTDVNNNKLNHEIELFNKTSGRLIAWVNIPQLSSMTNTILYLYYGNPDAENQQNASAVWDSNFVMVHHLNETSGTHYDRTANHNDGSPQGGVNQNAVGKIDGADEFDGANDCVAVLDSPTLHITGPITIEAWFRSSRGLTNQNNTWFGGLGKGGSYELGWQGWTDGWTFQVYRGGTRLYVDSNNMYMPKDEWHYIVGQYDGQYLRLLIDGQIVANKYIGSGTVDVNTRAFQIGLHTWGSSYWNGTIDEVRISNITRSSAWIMTSYNNQKDPTTFYTIKEEEPIPQAPVVFAPSPPNKAKNISPSLSEITFNITDYQDDPMNYTITTNPYIGSDTGTNVASGKFTLNVTGLQYLTTYEWIVSVTDGNHSTNITFSFTTLPTMPPIQEDPILVKGEQGNIVCYNQTTYDPDGDKVTNIYNWYKNGISITNLVLPFDTNNSATTKDYSGYNNNGIVIRDVTWTSNGIVGGAYNFNRGYIQIPGTNTLDGGGSWSEITVEAWIKLSAYPPSGTSTRIIARIPSYEIGITSGKQLFASIWTATGNPMISGHNMITTNATLNLNTWYHIVLTYKKGENMTLYVNGQMATTKTLSESSTLNFNIQPSGTINPLYIGWFDYFKGIIDEVRIYPKSLTPQQIYQRYSETKDGQTNSSTIVQAELLTGDAWYCKVTPNDSHQDGTTKTSNTITIGQNNKPSAKNLTITPQTPKTNDDLIGNYTFFDPDGDPENTTLTEIRWYRNDVLVPELNNTLTVPSNYTTKGEIWYFTVRPSDGTEFGDIYESPRVLIQNSAPQIINFTPEETTLEINETETIEFTHTSTDPDNDTLTYSWLLDGIEKSTSQNWTYTTDYNSSGTHTITLIVYDTELAEAQQQWTIIVHNVNRSPEASNLTISPSNPTTTDDLIANYIYYDPDGDSENGTEIRWYKDGELQPHLNDILTVPANETAKGETWYFSVKPKDGTDFGQLQTSPNVVIQNDPPQITYIAITPDPAYTNDTLTVYLTTFDADEDNITIAYQWQKYNETEGEWQDIPEATNETLAPENFIKGDKIKVICIPYDGGDYGAPQEANITISNAQPEIIDYYPLQENVTISEGTFQEFNVTCSDIDGDYLNITWCIYYSNGTLKETAMGESYTFNADTGSAGTYTIQVIVSDGEDETFHQWTLIVQPS